MAPIKSRPITAAQFRQLGPREYSGVQAAMMETLKDVRPGQGIDLEGTDVELKRYRNSLRAAAVALGWQLQESEGGKRYLYQSRIHTDGGKRYLAVLRPGGSVNGRKKD
jgi:hypothetical protein